MSNEIKRELEKIEIPAELHNRVKLGVDKAKQEKLDEQGIPPRKQTHVKRYKGKLAGLVAAALVGVTLSSGFFLPSMNKVLASTPLLGGVYEKFGDKIGMHLAEQNFVTELDQEMTKNGVTVKLTHAYFDGDVVSVTGQVSGDLEKGKNEPGEVSLDVNFDYNKGDSDPWLNGMSTGMQEAEDGYEFQWKMNYPHKNIEEEFTLPITIHSINGIAGEWNFEVPLTQEASTVFDLEHVQKYDDVTIKINEWKQSNASSTVTFETVAAHEGDYIDLYKAEDVDGNVLFHYANNTELSRSKEEDGYHQTLRKTVDQIKEGTKAITFYPSVDIEDPVVEQRLNKKSFTLESKRSDLAIKVNSVKQKDGQLILDYEFQGLSDNLSGHEFEMIHHNLSYAFTLVDKDFVGKIDPENPVPPEGHSISRNEVIIKDKDEYQFQSVFKLDGEETIKDFTLKDTVLQMDFDSFIPVKELKAFTVELPRD